MSSKVTDNLSREKMQQLLAAVGSEPTEDTSQIEAAEYNWHEPHYFSSEQLGNLDDLARKIAATVAEKFANFCQSEFDVTVGSTTQHFAEEFHSQSSDGEQEDYYLPFGTNQEHPCGLIGIPEQTAVIWTTQLLGDSDSEEDSGRVLSQLEESLLLDLASALVEAFSSPCSSFDFQSGDNVVRGQWPLELDGTQELFKISFDVKKAGSESASGAYFLILCSQLESAAGKTTRTGGSVSAEDTSKAILEHLQEMPVSITARLASTVLTFEQLMSLRAEDILLLGRRIDQPAELILDGQTVCYGWPAKSAGKYAVTITATAFGQTAQNINPDAGT